jgi:hypothetical protein
MAVQFNRIIGYTQSWKSTFLIALILATVLCFILIFLQPFDTYSTEMPYKNLKLAGYAVPIVLSILAIHFVENSWFQKASKWTFLNEVIVIIFGGCIMIVLSFVYLNNVVNSTALPWSEFFGWFQVFGLPFAPILLLLWIYLRFRFGKIEFIRDAKQAIRTVKIQGTNANEDLVLNWPDFLVAKSQANYIEIFHRDQSQQITKKTILRSTLSKVLDQLPEATQIHRSYIANLENIVKVEGNMRKGWCYINGMDDKVPVSPKHFKAIKTHLQTHP